MPHIRTEYLASILHLITANSAIGTSGGRIRSAHLRVRVRDGAHGALHGHGGHAGHAAEGVEGRLGLHEPAGEQIHHCDHEQSDVDQEDADGEGDGVARGADEAIPGEAPRQCLVVRQDRDAHGGPILQNLRFHLLVNGPEVAALTVSVLAHALQGDDAAEVPHQAYEDQDPEK